MMEGGGRRGPQPVPIGAGEWEGASGGLQSNVAFSPHTKVEVTVFSFENQSWYSQGVAVTMPRVPRHQGPSGWAGGSVPPRG